MRSASLKNSQHSPMHPDIALFTSHRQRGSCSQNLAVHDYRTGYHTGLQLLFQMLRLLRLCFMMSRPIWGLDTHSRMILPWKALVTISLTYSSNLKDQTHLRQTSRGAQQLQLQVQHNAKTTAGVAAITFCISSSSFHPPLRDSAAHSASSACFTKPWQQSTTPSQSSICITKIHYMLQLSAI
jgi:hypothetical protein